MPNYRTPLPGVLAGLLEAAVNRLLATDQNSAARLERLDGRLVELQIEGFGIDLFFAFTRHRVQVGLEAGREPDTVISGTPPALFAMALPEEDSGWSRPGSRVRIAGDATLARDLERLFSRLDPDWEAELSIWFGEVLGPQIASGGKAALEQLRESAVTFREWTGDYLQQADGPLAQAPQIREFSAAVDALRDATDRLEARLRILRTQKTGINTQKAGASARAETDSAGEEE